MAADSVDVLNGDITTYPATPHGCARSTHYRWYERGIGAGCRDCDASRGEVSNRTVPLAAPGKYVPLVSADPVQSLLRHLADKTGLTGGLSRALATPRILVHDRGRVLADLACAIADGAGVISDYRVMSDQRELFGLVASVPTAWRTLAEIARGGARADRRVLAAVSMARRHAWAVAGGITGSTRSLASGTNARS
jgi:hypothetical protein